MVSSLGCSSVCQVRFWGVVATEVFHGHSFPLCFFSYLYHSKHSIFALHDQLEHRSYTSMWLPEIEQTTKMTPCCNRTAINWVKVLRVCSDHRHRHSLRWLYMLCTTIWRFETTWLRDIDLGSGYSRDPHGLLWNSDHPHYHRPWLQWGVAPGHVLQQLQGSGHYRGLW